MTRILVVLLALTLSIAQLIAQPGERALFGRLDVAALAGTTGVGFDVAVEVNEHVSIRTGFSYMPQIKYPLFLSVSLEDGLEEVEYYDPIMKEQQNQKMASLLETLASLTGIEADSRVDIHVVPKYFNGKLLVDWRPLSNKAWHFTAGFYAGPSHIGTAYNYAEETAFLQALNGYNHIYDNIKNQRPVISVGDASTELTPELTQKFLDYGRATFYIGPQKDGEYYHTVPAEDGSIRADCYTNAFKPYLGFGYTREIGLTGRCTLSMEGGWLFWGGKPRIITHDGVDLAHDMEYIKKETLRHLIDGVSALKGLPLLEVRVAWRVF